MKLSTDIVSNLSDIVNYASICVSEKGIPNEIVKTKKGANVVLTESGDYFEFIQK